MITDVSEKTMKLLQACKDAGYERVTVFVADKRVPCSVAIRKGSTGWGVDEDGMFMNENTGSMVFRPKRTHPAAYWGTNVPGGLFKVVCGAPEQRGEHPVLPGDYWPKMWGIIKRLGLGGSGGSADGHDVSHPPLLTAGYYDLADVFN